MRLASFNLFSGRSLQDGRVVASRLEEAITELAADVIGLQEVDRNQPRSDGLDMTATVAAAMGDATFRFAPALQGTPGEEWSPLPSSGSLPPNAPAYGCGLVSRLPVASWHSVMLPAAPVRSPILVPSATGGRPQALWLRDEPRVGIAAVLTLASGQSLTVATTHLSFVPGWNLVQLRVLARGLAALPGPLVLMGDLNLPGGLPSLALRGWRNVSHGLKTYPAPAPKVQFDHAFVRDFDDLPPIAKAWAAELALSDHRALVLDLDD